MRILHRIASALSRPRSVIFMLLALLCTACGPVALHAQQEQYPTQPTQEELTMTSVPQAPGAAAVYLYREEKSDDTLNQHTYYFRVKVLTEAGRKCADVRLSTTSDNDIESFSMPELGQTVTAIEGRTIHSDGTVIPFTGKPYTRIVVDAKGIKETETVFTLSDVEVGSILEYRYNVTSISDFVSYAPNWYVQQDLYTLKGFFSWKSQDYNDVSDANYNATLPTGTSVTVAAAPSSGASLAYHTYSLAVHDIPPIPKEDYMPPLRSSIYRVNFFYGYSKSEAEFWKDAGKEWAKGREQFLGNPDNMKDAAQTLVAAGDTDTVKLQKIYAAVMAMDNTSFSREHDKQEDKAHHLGDVKSVQDVWQRKRGDDDELTLLFIALARAAGLKAYDMRVTNRDTNLFLPVLHTLDQLNDDVAIVVLNGTEQFFDPGQKECPFGQLAWKHTSAGGLRESRMVRQPSRPLRSRPIPSRRPSALPTLP